MFMMHASRRVNRFSIDSSFCTHLHKTYQEVNIIVHQKQLSEFVTQVWPGYLAIYGSSMLDCATCAKFSTGFEMCLALQNAGNKSTIKSLTREA